MLGAVLFTEVTVTVIAWFVTTGVVVLAVAFSTRRISASISGEVGALKGTMNVHTDGAPGAGGGSSPITGPLTWLPLWKQSAGLLPDGSPDPQQYNDCGETCVAMVIAALTGVLMEPGAIRQQLGGSERSGLTTGTDLVTAFALNGVSASTAEHGASVGWDVCVAAYGQAEPAIILGNWLSPDCLHWMLLDDKHPGYLTMIDPWTGTETPVTHARWAAQFAGSIVLVGGRCRRNCRPIPTPGTGASS